MDLKNIPNYRGSSIINLTSSILRNYNIVTDYPPLDILPQGILADSTKLVLFVIDGLGYDFLVKHGQETIFNEYLRGKLSSVFPTTTASAMLSYYTGEAPKNHGIPAWFTYLRQIGMISTILPFTPRIKNMSLTEFGVNPQEIYTFHSHFDDLEVKQHIFNPNEFEGTPLTNKIAKYRNNNWYTDLHGLFSSLDEIMCQKSNESQFIFVYWHKIDELAHNHGINHQKTKDHLKELDQYFRKYIPKWKVEDPFSRVIISADHGLIDIPKENQLNLEQFPSLYHSLILPLSGEARVPFFYVRSDQVEEFKNQIQYSFKGLGKLFSRKEILESELMGLFNIHPELPMRLGDYLFVFEEPYVLKDTLLGQQRSEMVGHHGGLSFEELFVPLIVI